MLQDAPFQRLGIVVATVALASFLAPPWVLQIGIFALSRAIVVLGLVVLMRSGLVSFGQALYFGVGGYAVGLLSLRFGITDVMLRVVVGTFAAALVGAAVGQFLRSYRAIFFAMLSLAISMVFYGLLIKSEALGSSDGFKIAAFTIFGMKPPEGLERLTLFILTLLAAGSAAALVQLYWRSTLGRLDTALRDNEVRLEYLGISAAHLVHLKIIIAAALAGCGGALSATAVGHVDPAMAFWISSGELVFVAILGGTGSVLAPFLGSFMFEAVHSFAQHVAPGTWRMILGFALLLVIVILPGGLWSIGERKERAS